MSHEIVRERQAENRVWARVDGKNLPTILAAKAVGAKVLRCERTVGI